MPPLGPPTPAARPLPAAAAGDMESEVCHLGAIIVRDLSCVVSNYRSVKTLDQ